MVGTLFGTGRHHTWYVDEEDSVYETCVAS